MTTQSDLLKRAYELIAQRGRFARLPETSCVCLNCEWLRDYEAAMREPTKPFHAPTCLSTVYGAGVTCTCGVGKDAPSPATEQNSYIEDLRRDLKDSAYAEKYLAAAKAESPEAYEVAQRDVTAATEQGPTDTSKELAFMRELQLEIAASTTFRSGISIRDILKKAARDFFAAMQSNKQEPGK